VNLFDLLIHREMESRRRRYAPEREEARREREVAALEAIARAATEKSKDNR
jgi:hypothetical protein